MLAPPVTSGVAALQPTPKTEPRSPDVTRIRFVPLFLNVLYEDSVNNRVS